MLLGVLILAILIYAGLNKGNILSVNKSSQNISSTIYDTVTTPVRVLSLSESSCITTQPGNGYMSSTYSVGCWEQPATTRTVPGSAKCQPLSVIAADADIYCTRQMPQLSPIPTSRFATPTMKASNPTECPNLPGNGSVNTCVNGSSCPAGYTVFGNATNNACGGGKMCCNRFGPTATSMPTPKILCPGSCLGNGFNGLQCNLPGGVKGKWASQGKLSCTGAAGFCYICQK